MTGLMKVVHGEYKIEHTGVLVQWAGRSCPDCDLFHDRVDVMRWEPCMRQCQFDQLPHSPFHCSSRSITVSHSGTIGKCWRQSAVERDSRLVTCR